MFVSGSIPRSPLDLLHLMRCAPLPLEKFLNPKVCLDEERMNLAKRRKPSDSLRGEKWKSGFDRFSESIGTVPQLELWEGNLFHFAFKVWVSMLKGKLMFEEFVSISLSTPWSCKGRCQSQLGEAPPIQDGLDREGDLYSGGLRHRDASCWVLAFQ